MKNITFPLRPGDEGVEVINLQTALILLLSKKVIEIEPGIQEELLQQLAEESQGPIYKDGTMKAIIYFQELLPDLRHIHPTGEVDVVTATVLNATLREMGALDLELASKHFIVSGEVWREDDLPLRGMRIRAFHQAEQGSIRLGEDTTDIEGLYTIHYDLLPGLDRVDLLVSALDEDGILLQSSELIRQADAIEFVNLTIFKGQRPKQRRIEGQVIFEDGRPAEHLKLRLCRLEFGRDEPLTLIETATRAEGKYALVYTLPGPAASLEIHALKSENEWIPLSEPLNDLEEMAEVNLVAPSNLSPLASEYQRLTEDLSSKIGEIKKLTDVVENHERQDITVLNRDTGWDARLIALATITEQLRGDQEVNLPGESMYGLLRAGLPSDKLLLAQVEPDAAELALKTVRDAGIVALDDEKITKFKEAFTEFRDKIRLNLPLPGSRSTYGVMLKTSGITDDAQTKFASVYLNHRGNADQLWKKAIDAGIDTGDIRKLQLQGKLAFLAGNSDGMTLRMLKKEISDPVELIDRGFYNAETWMAEVFEQAEIPEDRRPNLSQEDRDKLNGLIPAVYTGEELEARLDAYTKDMARKLRLSYPTQVLAHQIENVAAFKSVADAITVKLLRNAVGQGFRLGDTPIDAFLKTHTGVTLEINDEDLPHAHQQIRTLQRIYQITPSNEAIPVLLDMGITSAYDLTAFSEAEFRDRYIHKYVGIYKTTPPSSEIERIHLKSKQVSSVIYNLFTVAKKLDSDLSIAGMAASAEVRENAKNELIKQFPTMESLFGSMDFCECEHCRSVLSPAAYLVDLLQSLEEWGETRPYPKDKGYQQPYDTLIEKRPDIPHIPLTCENTHTALPYIDIVNEIFEYFVANQKLDAKAAQDTGSATTAELMAEPHNVIGKAYEKLLEAHYPLNLPFDLWIETVRQFCNYFETPLHQLLEVFRRSDELFVPTQTFDRFNIFMEFLGLTPKEIAIFTDPDPLSDLKWYKLYGYSTAKPAIQNPGTETQGIAEYATIDIADDHATEFSTGDLCTYFDTSANKLHNEVKTILRIGDPGSGGPSLTKITFEGIWNNPPDSGDQLVYDAPTTLRSAKTLSRRLGVTYKEIIEVVHTGFINSELTKLGLLYKLNLSIRDAHLYKEHQLFYQQNKKFIKADRSTLSSADQLGYDALTNKVTGTELTGWEILTELYEFEHRLKTLSTEFDTSPDMLESDILGIQFEKVLVLLDSDTGCNFDQTTLQYSEGSKAKPIDFLRINLFVRLWRKLGWSIEETDLALCAFMPHLSPFDEISSNLKKQPLKTVLIYLAHLKALDEKFKLGNKNRIKLLTLWVNIPTTGKNPLYDQLFLKKSVLKTDPVFDHPLGGGQYLSSSWVEKLAASNSYTVELDVAPANQINNTLFAGEPVEFFYDKLREVQRLKVKGILSDTQKESLAQKLPASTELPLLLDAAQKNGQAFSKIKGHMLALQGALTLTANEIDRILRDAELSIETASLSLENVSMLYRYGFFAKALKLSVSELIALKQISDRDPFKLLHRDALKSIDQDHPFSQTLNFVEIVEQVKDSGLKTEDLDYLLRHRFDEIGKYRPNTEATLSLLKTIADGVSAFRIEHSVPQEPEIMGEDLLRQKLGLVLTPNVIELFFAMMNGTAEFTATKASVTSPLQPEEYADEPAIRQVSYNQTRAEQRLTVRVFDPQRAGLETRHPSTLFTDLLKDAHSQARDFFDYQLKKEKLRVDNEAGFLDEEDFKKLFDPLKPLKEILPTDTQRQINNKLKKNEEINAANQKTLQARRFRTAQAFFPFLQQRLIRQFVVHTMTAHTSSDPALVGSLLTDERLLGGPTPILESFSALGNPGVNVTFYSRRDFSGEIPPTVNATDIDTGLKVRSGEKLEPIKPSRANSVKFEGYLTVPVSGAYRFYIVFEKKNTEAVLSFDHLSQIFLSSTAENNGDEISGYLQLKPGIPYLFTLNVAKLNKGNVRLLVQGETIPKGPISQLSLYPLRLMLVAEQAFIVLSKALQLVQSLGLSEREIRHMLIHADNFRNINLKTLPVRDAQQELEIIALGKIDADNSLSIKQAIVQARSENPELTGEADQVKSHFRQFLPLTAYARLKRDLAGGTDDLIGIFEAAGTTKPSERYKNVYPLIAKLMRSDVQMVKSVANALFSKEPDFASGQPFFTNKQPLQRLWEAVQVVERFGVPVASLLEWPRIVRPDLKFAQSYEIARDLKEAIKARYEPETWQRVAHPIFDILRQRQRNALVSYILHQLRFSSMEQLYEYFLIDPGMEPVVQTSRIRLAIASVQLFIQRCLLNLEPKVHPAVINTKHWEWMKRYRVWEANRKIFLFPENWLEPEFRDDKTHLFTELEGELLQGDVSNDLVEDAFLNYLKKLDELARLEIVAMHIEEVDAANRILHVFGRSFNMSKYYYRRYARQMWTPWEPVSVEIQGDHLAPVVWRDRLYLFWVTFLDKPIMKSNTTGPSDSLAGVPVNVLINALNNEDAVLKKIDIQLHWSEYLQGRWSPPAMGGFVEDILGKGSLSNTNNFKLNFDLKSIFVHVSKEYNNHGEEGGVFIHLIGNGFNRSFYLAGGNSAPDIRLSDSVTENGIQGITPANPFSSANTPQANRYSGKDEFKVTFQEKITTEPGKTPPKEIASLIQKPGSFTILPCNNNLMMFRVPHDAFEDASDPKAVEAELEKSIGEIGSLIKPFFYQDNTHTFFVEPEVDEQTVEDWQEWVTRTPQPEPEQQKPGWWKNFDIVPQISNNWPIPKPGKVFEFDSRSRFTPRLDRDWLTNPSTVLEIGDALIGPLGQPGLQILANGMKDGDESARTLVTVNPGSSIETDSYLLLTNSKTLEQAGLRQVAGGLNVIGRSGFNTALKQNFNQVNRLGSSAGISNASQIGR